MGGEKGLDRQGKNWTAGPAGDTDTEQDKRKRWRGEGQTGSIAGLVQLLAKDGFTCKMRRRLEKWKNLSIGVG